LDKIGSCPKILYGWDFHEYETKNKPIKKGGKCKVTADCPPWVDLKN
jgi:hypothetical protein